MIKRIKPDTATLCEQVGFISLGIPPPPPTPRIKWQQMVDGSRIKSQQMASWLKFQMIADGLKLKSLIAVIFVRNRKIAE